MRKSNAKITPIVTCAENNEFYSVDSNTTGGKELDTVSSSHTSEYSMTSFTDLPNVTTTALMESSIDNPITSVGEEDLIARGRRILVQSSSSSPLEDDDSRRSDGMISIHERSKQETVERNFLEINSENVDAIQAQDDLNNDDDDQRRWEIYIGKCSEVKDKDSDWAITIDDISKDQNLEEDEWKTELNEQFEVQNTKKSDNDWSANIDSLAVGISDSKNEWTCNLPDIQFSSGGNEWSSNISSIALLDADNKGWKFDLRDVKGSQDKEWDFKLSKPTDEERLIEKDKHWKYNLHEVDVSNDKSAKNEWKNNIRDISLKNDDNWKTNINLVKEKTYSKGWKYNLPEVSCKKDVNWKMNLKSIKEKNYSKPWKTRLNDISFKDENQSRTWTTNLDEIKSKNDPKDWRSNLSDITNKNCNEDWAEYKVDNIEGENKPSHWSSSIDVGLNEGGLEAAKQWSEQIKEVQLKGDEKCWKYDIRECENFTESKMKCDIREVKCEKDPAWNIEVPEPVYSDGGGCIIL